MKLFAIYLDISITSEPEWLDSFRKRYDEPHNLHLTLIQPRHIDDDEIISLRQTIATVIEESTFNSSDTELIFDQLVIEQQTDGNYIFMLFPRCNESLLNLQLRLRRGLSNYARFYNPETEEYEINFRPHITIGRGLDGEQRRTAEECFAPGFEFRARIGQLIMPVVADTSIEEATNPDNLTRIDIVSKAQ